MDRLLPDRYLFLSSELMKISCHVASSEFEGEDTSTANAGTLNQNLAHPFSTNTTDGNM